MAFNNCCNIFFADPESSFPLDDKILRLNYLKVDRYVISSCIYNLERNGVARGTNNGREDSALISMFIN